MDEQEKVFDAVSIVLLVLISLANDAAEVFFDILAATVVGIPGEAIMEPINLLIDGVVTSWFFIKCGFGGPSMAQILDDLLELVGIPGRTICVVFGIYVANNPNSFLGRIGQTAASIESGGESGAMTKEVKTLQGVQALGGYDGSALRQPGLGAAHAQLLIGPPKHCFRRNPVV